MSSIFAFVAVGLVAFAAGALIAWAYARGEHQRRVEKLTQEHGKREHEILTRATAAVGPSAPEIRALAGLARLLSMQHEAVARLPHATPDTGRQTAQRVVTIEREIRAWVESHRRLLGAVVPADQGQRLDTWKWVGPHIERAREAVNDEDAWPEIRHDAGQAMREIDDAYLKLLGRATRRLGDLLA